MSVFFVNLSKVSHHRLYNITDIIVTKSFIRPLLAYDDIVYDQAFNESFRKKRESIQYNSFKG